MKRWLAIAVVVAVAGGGLLVVQRSGWMRRTATSPASQPKPAPEADINPGRSPAGSLPKSVSAFIESHCLDCHDDSSSKGGLNFDHR